MRCITWFRFTSRHDVAVFLWLPRCLSILCACTYIAMNCPCDPDEAAFCFNNDKPSACLCVRRGLTDSGCVLAAAGLKTSSLSRSASPPVEAALNSELRLKSLRCRLAMQSRSASCMPLSPRQDTHRHTHSRIRILRRILTHLPMHLAAQSFRVAQRRRGSRAQSAPAHVSYPRTQLPSTTRVSMCVCVCVCVLAPTQLPSTTRKEAFDPTPDA
jgi:hypothetical protein